ncbi:hypothetical protein PV755_46375, partial [Streptomyces caniscabiei]|nr:hypothetical protein [Streptomyces caniscabiei]MDX3516232.1 hypothetical protein [Streptomyces caniscabiei]MDX3717409.1 hypothetical protein [Streptomyces caniscabiei]
MGIRLIVEILDHWQDVGLTAGERGDLIVLAENANDKSRETWGPVHAEHILKRAAKTPASWRIAINRLMKKKALEFALRDGKEIRGYTGQHAVYRIVELCPEPPHSGYKGHCTKPEKGVDSADTPAPEEGYPPANPVDEDPEEGYLTANPEDYLTANAVDGEGYLTATERVSGQLTPTPLYSSFDLSSKDSPSSSVAEDSCSASVIATDADDGGGGGDLSLEEITKQAERAASFVDSLAYRGRQPGKKQRQKICQLVVAAFKEGWTENGLRRYLDISDDATVRSPAAVYVHRLSKDELPEASVGVSPQLPPACSWCLARNPAAATDPAERVAPLGGPCPDCHPTSVGQSTMQLPPACPECLSWSPEAATDVNLRVDRMSFHGGPCPRCHPATMGQSPEVPPACELCIAENPAAEFNVRFRYRVIDDEHQACPNCHPKRIIVLAAQRRDTADGGMWERAAARAAQRKATGARAAAHTA